MEIYHDIKISKRTLKRRLRQYGLNRSTNNISVAALRQILEMEIQGAGALKGYRGMWSHLKFTYGIRDTVMQLLREIDPEGTQMRRCRRFMRRIYNSPGPNHCWHIDSYDKLKYYGLPIHGCVDGFSRKIILLEVVKSNNNPLVPAYHFLETVRTFGYCPRILRTDCGTENGIMADCQCFLLNDEKRSLIW